MSHGGSRAVLLVVGVEDEKDVKSLYEDWVWLVLLWAVLVKHVEEVLDVSRLVVGRVEFSSDSMSVGVGSKGREVA